MNVTGHCLCGFVSYAAEVDENLVVICHCTACQRHSASSFGIVVGANGDEFELLTGTLKSYESVADSGSMRSRTFCPECGSRIYAKPVSGDSGLFSIRVGTVDQRDQLIPKVQIWCRSAQPWALIDSLPKYDKQPSTEEYARIAADVAQ